MPVKTAQYVQIGKASMDIPYTPKRTPLKRKRSSVFWSFKVGESREYECADSGLLIGRTAYVARATGWRFKVHSTGPRTARVWRVK